MSDEQITTAELARRVQFTQSAIAKWRKQYEDAPTENSVEQWQAFIAKHGLGRRGNHKPENLRDAELRKKTAETRLLEIKIAKEERAVIPSKDVDTFLLHAASRIRSSLYQTFQTELPPKTAGLDVTEVRRLNREACDVLMLSMQTLQDEWQAEQEKAREAAMHAAETSDAER
jgi:hypothetical protein